MNENDLLEMIKELQKEVKYLKGNTEYDYTKPIIYNSKNDHYLNLNNLAFIKTSQDKDQARTYYLASKHIGELENSYSRGAKLDYLLEEYNRLLKFFEHQKNHHPFYIAGYSLGLINLRHINYIYIDSKSSYDCKYTISFYNEKLDESSVKKIENYSSEKIKTELEANQDIIKSNKYIFQFKELNTIINLLNLSRVQHKEDENGYHLEILFKSDIGNSPYTIVLSSPDGKILEKNLEDLINYSQKYFNKGINFNYSHGNIVSL